MCSDSTYWLAFSLLIVGSFSFVIGRFYERADRWLKDRDEERRAVKAAKAARDALITPPKPKKETKVRERFAAFRKGIAQVAARGGEVALWR